MDGNGACSEAVAFADIDLAAMDLGAPGVGVGVVDLEDAEVDIVEIDFGDLGITGAFENQGMRAADCFVESEEAIGIAFGGGLDGEVIAEHDGEVEVHLLAFGGADGRGNIFAGVLGKSEGIASEDQAAREFADGELVEGKACGKVVGDRRAFGLIKAEEIVGVASGRWGGAGGEIVCPVGGIAPVSAGDFVPSEGGRLVVFGDGYGDNLGGTILGGDGVGLGLGEVAGGARRRGGGGERGDGESGSQGAEIGGGREMDADLIFGNGDGGGVGQSKSAHLFGRAWGGGFEGDEIGFGGAVGGGDRVSLGLRKIAWGVRCGADGGAFGELEFGGELGEVGAVGSGEGEAIFRAVDWRESWESDPAESDFWGSDEGLVVFDGEEGWSVFGDVGGAGEAGGFGGIDVLGHVAHGDHRVVMLL